MQASSDRMFLAALEHENDLVVLQHETLVEPGNEEVCRTRGTVQDQVPGI